MSELCDLLSSLQLLRDLRLDADVLRVVRPDRFPLDYDKCRQDIKQSADAAHGAVDAVALLQRCEYDSYAAHLLFLSNLAQHLSPHAIALPEYPVSSVEADCGAIATNAINAVGQQDYEGYHTTFTKLQQLQEALQSSGLTIHTRVATEALQRATKCLSDDLAKEQQKAKASNDIPVVAGVLKKIQSVACSAPSALPQVHAAAEDVLNYFEQSDAYGEQRLSALQAFLLGASDSASAMVLEDHKLHFVGVAEATWCARCPVRSMDELVDKIQPALSAEEASNLKLLVERYCEGISYYTKSPEFRGRSLEDTKKAVMQKLGIEAASARKDPKAETVVAVLVQLSLMYALSHCSPSAFPPKQLPTLHAAQVLCILVLLGLGQGQSATVLARLLASAHPARFADPPALATQLAQMQGADGKTTTLACLGALMATLGLNCDIICRSEWDAHRAESSFRPLFTSLQLGSSAVRFMSLPQLSASLAANVVNAVKPLIVPSPDAIDCIVGPEQVIGKRRRMLLCDDGSAILSSAFRDGLTECVVTVSTPDVQDLIREVYTSRDDASYDVAASPKAALVIGAFHPQAKPIAQLALAELVSSSRRYRLRACKLNACTKRVEYLLDGSWTDRVAYPNETPFAYLQFAESGEITAAEAAEHVFLSISLGHFSTEELLARGFYCATVGVMSGACAIGADGKNH